MKRPLFRSQGTALVVGTVLFLAGAFCLHDAFEGRGATTPRPLRPFTFW